MEIKYIIVKKYDSGLVRHNDRMYWNGEGWISNIMHCSQFDSDTAAKAAIILYIKEKGIFQIEKIFIK